MSIRDIAWLAGLCEGEGYFACKGSSPHIAIVMTDQDVIERVASLFKGRATCSRLSERNSRWSDAYIASVSGRHAAAWMMTLYPFLGKRRRAKVRECLAKWKASSHWSRGRKDERTLKGRRGLMSLPATCHPDRPVESHGLCLACYKRKNRRERISDPDVRKAACHPDRPFLAKGLCAACYRRQWVKRKSGEAA